MTKSKLKEYLIKTVGPNYINYPECVKFNLKMLSYSQKFSKKSLDK